MPIISKKRGGLSATLNAMSNAASNATLNATSNAASKAACNAKPAECDHLRRGFVGNAEARVPFHRLHCHDDIEISVNEHAPVAALFGAERILLPPNHLVVFWAARPHGPIETASDSWAYDIHLPLPWVLQWRLPRVLIHALLSGQVLVDPPGDRPAADLDVLKNWIHYLQAGLPDAQNIVLLEAESRLRRLASDMALRATPQRLADDALPQSPGMLGRFERMATLIATHYQEPLAVADVADAVHMTPAQAMRVFRKFSGMTLHEVLIQHRTSHAQRLLVTTDKKIDTIAAESGFGSPARFYACFQKLVGQSPAAYRRSFAADSGAVLHQVLSAGGKLSHGGNVELFNAPNNTLLHRSRFNYKR
jgi:AraC family transcriptional regulator, melibiose operon regulatory protein